MMKYGDMVMCNLKHGGMVMCYDEVWRHGCVILKHGGMVMCYDEVWRHCYAP